METAQHSAADLARALRQNLDRRDVAPIWRYGQQYRWSAVVNRWLALDCAGIVKPGQSLAALESACGAIVAIVDA